MNVNGLVRYKELEQLPAVTAMAASSSPSTGAGPSSETSLVSLSGPAEMLQRLSAMRESDPAKYKQVLTQMTDELAGGGGSQNKTATEMLRELSESFAAALRSGALPELGSAGPARSKDAASLAARVHEAYARNGPPEARPDDAIKRALDVATTLFDTLTSKPMSSLSTSTAS